MDKFYRAQDRLTANGFVFKHASGCAHHAYEKVSESGTTWAFLFMSGAVRYKFIESAK